MLPQSLEDMRAGGRRPADLYLPAWLGSPVVLDFAVAAPQRQATSMQAGAVAEACPCHKEDHLGTAIGTAAEVAHFANSAPKSITSTDSDIQSSFHAQHVPYSCEKV